MQTIAQTFRNTVHTYVYLLSGQSMHVKLMFKTIYFFYESEALAEFRCNLCRHSVQSTGLSTVSFNAYKNDTNRNVYT